MDELAETGATLTHQLLDNPDYMQASNETIPNQYRVPNEDSHPNFMTVDFGLVRNSDGSLSPKLVELQAFPSIFGYQDILASQYIETYGLDPNLTWYLGGLDENSYWQLLRQVIVGDHDPENVVLLEIDPDHQKTLPDFHVYEDKLHITTVDIAKLRKQGNRLFYQRDGRDIPIHRIYNRAIVDELERKNIQLPFDYRDPLDVEWAGHPNWYFRISKFSLPFLNHPSVPKAVFLDDWFTRPTSKAFRINAKASCSSPFTPSRGREFSLPPPTKTSIPSRRPSATFTFCRSAFTLNLLSKHPTAPPRPRSASCTSGPTAAHSSRPSPLCASAAD